MRVHRCITMLAAVGSLGLTAPAALATTAGVPSGPSDIPAATPIHHGGGDSTAWLIGAGAAASVLVVSGGVVVTRRSRTVDQPAPKPTGSGQPVRTH